MRENTGIRLVVLLLSFFFLLLLAAALGESYKLIPGISSHSALLLASATQCIVAFCLPAWIAAKFSSNDNPWTFLSVKTSAPARAFAGVVVVYCLALPAMNQLIDWNAHISFPEWAKGLEATLRQWEEANNGVAMQVLQTSSLAGMLLTVAIVGLLTGFSEEIFFRGAMQRIFLESQTAKWVAIWGTAVIFSAIHFQFFGFFPRLLMGAFFGYLIVWTGSLWPAVFAHALNNSMVVVAYHALGDSVSWNIDNIGIAHEGELPMTALASVIATALFFMKFRNFFFKGAPLPQKSKSKTSSENG